MAISKIRYGIDLGTTNSSIATLKNGEPFIFQSDLREDVIPSCVSFTAQKQVRTGFPALNDYYGERKAATRSWKKAKSNAFVEFKRSMGTDTEFKSSNMKRGYHAEELSAEVLKSLRSFVTDENVRQVVITVPAKFNVNQKAATMEAAKKAGFEHCQLLQEPVAASFAYGLQADDENGVWMVFDFGGGTFDAALVHSQNGVLQVFDTEGDSFLGGKDLDYAIVNRLLIPALSAEYDLESFCDDEEKMRVLRDSLKIHAENLRKKVSSQDMVEMLTDLGELGCDDAGDEIELDATFSRSEVYQVMDEYYQRAVDICRDLLDRNSIRREKLTKIILVGGPTYCPLVRDKLREQICDTVDTSINPMTAVAVGAAFFAQTVDGKELQNEAAAGSVRFSFRYESSTVNPSEWVAFTCLDRDRISSGISLEFVRSDGAWSSGRINAAAEQGDLAELQLVENRANQFEVRAFDDSGSPVAVFPDEISIINGTKVSSAVLPYNICFSRQGVYHFNKTMSEVALFGGLKKNIALPTVGISNGNVTTEAITKKSGCVRIPLYQADYAMQDGDDALCYEHVADISISYDDIKQELPMGTPVSLKLKIDASEMMDLEAYFPAIDVTVTKSVDVEINKSELLLGMEIDRLHSGINYIELHCRSKTPAFVGDFERVWSEDDSDGSEKAAKLERLRRIFRIADRYRRAHDVEFLKYDIAQALDSLEERGVLKRALESLGIHDEGWENWQGYDDMDYDQLKETQRNLCAMDNSYGWSDNVRSFLFGERMRNPECKGYKDPARARKLYDKLEKDDFDVDKNMEIYTELESLIPRERFVQTGELSS